MNFFQVWLTGYIHPARMVEQLRDKPAPQWGLGGQLGRGLLDALLPYLPLWLLGRQPTTPSYLTFLPTEQYYGALVLLAPVVLLVAVVHVILELSGREEVHIFFAIDNLRRAVTVHIDQIKRAIRARPGITVYRLAPVAADVRVHKISSLCVGDVCELHQRHVGRRLWSGSHGRRGRRVGAGHPKATQQHNHEHEKEQSRGTHGLLLCDA